MGYTNVLQWVNDNIANKGQTSPDGYNTIEDFRINVTVQQKVAQHLVEKNLTAENYTPQTVIFNSKTYVIETFRGYACLRAALESETEEEYEKYMQEAIRYEVNS
tara:strand:+ start:1479 stop:1793 length:315 start_codon:yes stop_codon:yes gene_type:complete